MIRRKQGGEATLETSISPKSLYLQANERAVLFPERPPTTAMELSQKDLLGDGPQTEATAKKELPALDLTVTERAIEQLKNVAREEDVDTDAEMLRVAVVPGGCSGLTYDLGWDTTEQESDTTEKAGGLCFVLDKKSRLYLSGTEMDFTDGLQGEGFHFKNPQAERTCACGESFGV